MAKGHPWSLTDEKCIAVVRHESPALRAKAEVVLLLGWYRGNTSRPFVVDGGFFDRYEYKNAVLELIKIKQGCSIILKPYMFDRLDGCNKKIGGMRDAYKGPQGNKGYIA